MSALGAGKLACCVGQAKRTCGRAQAPLGVLRLFAVLAVGLVWPGGLTRANGARLRGTLELAHSPGHGGRQGVLPAGAAATAAAAAAVLAAAESARGRAGAAGAIAADARATHTGGPAQTAAAGGARKLRALNWGEGWEDVFHNQLVPAPRAPRAPARASLRRPFTPPTSPELGSPPEEPPTAPPPPPVRAQKPTPLRSPPVPRPPPGPSPSPPRPTPSEPTIVPSPRPPPVPRRTAISVPADRGQVQSPPPSPPPPRPPPPPPSPPPPRPPPPPAMWSSPSIDPLALLDAHNVLRGLTGVANLTWDNNLARTAQAWADKCSFQHSTNSNGENLAWGLVGTPDWVSRTGVAMWADEVCDYNFASPGIVTAGHWTQIVWKATQKLGCGYTSCNDAPFGYTGGYLVCEYYPAGNTVGAAFYKANVFAPRNLATTCTADRVPVTAWG